MHRTRFPRPRGLSLGRTGPPVGRSFTSWLTRPNPPVTPTSSARPSTEQSPWAKGTEPGEARPALSPPDLRKGRAVPPEHEAVLGHAGYRVPQATPAPARSLRRLLQRGAPAPGASDARHRR